MNQGLSEAGIILRDFRQEDQIPARRLIVAGLGEHFGSIDSALNPDLEDIASFYLDEGHSFIVASMGGEIVGTGGLIFESAYQGRIVRLSVRRDRREMGIGQAIVAELISRGRHFGLKEIRTETNLDWHPAISLYKSRGFIEELLDDVSLHLILVL